VTIGVGEESSLVVNPTLGDVVRHSNRYGARKSGHLC
jgi:hypothetical protein